MVHQVDNAINILFTSVGRRVELLRAFKQAYHNLQLRGQIVVTDIDPLAPALQDADCVHIVPRFSADEFVPTIVEICRRQQIDLILPLIDPDIPILARHRQQLEATGAQLMVVSSEAANICADKWLTTQFFQELGLLTPRSWLPQKLDQTDLTYPLFIKPRQGSAAKHTFRVNNSRELSFFLDYVPDPIVQECLTGPEITNDVICDLDGYVLGISSRQRLEVRSGEVSKGITVYDQTISDACKLIAQALPAVGPITVQCIIKDGEPYFIEINARLGGGIPLGIAAGVDAPRLLLANVAGIAQEFQPPSEYQVGLAMTRFDNSYFLSESERKAVGSNQ